MRKLLGFSGLLAGLVLALTAAPVSAGSAPLTVASGAFTIVGGHGVNRTEAFTVQQRSDGTVTGQTQLISFSGAIFHGDVNCFIRDGNQAIVGGTITKFAGNSAFVGYPYAFAIQDNPDVATFIFYGYDNPGDNGCEDLIPNSPFNNLADFLNTDTGFGNPITTGNIKISSP